MNSSQMNIKVYVAMLLLIFCSHCSLNKCINWGKLTNISNQLNSKGISINASNILDVN